MYVGCDDMSHCDAPLHCSAIFSVKFIQQSFSLSLRNEECVLFFNPWSMLVVPFPNASRQLTCRTSPLTDEHSRCRCETRSCHSDSSRSICDRCHRSRLSTGNWSFSFANTCCSIWMRLCNRHSLLFDEKQRSTSDQITFDLCRLVSILTAVDQ